VALFYRLVEGAPGGPLQRRLVDEELMLLAEADADPCSCCLAAWARGDAAPAVQRLLESLAAAAGGGGGGGGSSSGPTRPGAAASVRARSSRLSLISVGGDGGGYAAAAAAAAVRGGRGSAPAGPQRHVGGAQAALLDWLLSVGVRALAGREAPGLLPVWVRALALQCAHAAEVAGLPFAAAEALALGDAVGDPTAPPPAARGQLAAALDLMWRSRLAAACLLLSSAPAAVAAGGAGWPLAELPAAARRAARRSRSIGSGGSGSGSGSVAAVEPWAGLPDPSDEAAWAELLAAGLPKLSRALGLAVDAAAAAACLRRHAAALRPTASLLPFDGSAAPPHGLPLPLDGARSPPVPRRRSSAGAAPAAAAAEAAAAGGDDGAPAPDAALAICLKRAETDVASSLAGGAAGAGGASTISSLMASLPSLRRRGSAEATPSPGASPLAAGHAGGGLPGAGTTGGQSRAGRAAAADRVQHGLLGEPWDVAAGEGGDKQLRAVAAARGPGYGLAAAGGGAGGAAAGRPFAFAGARGGIRRGELAAPAGEDVSPSFRLGGQGSGSLLAGLMHQVGLASGGRGLLLFCSRATHPPRCLQSSPSARHLSPSKT
jgi:hypothetical protein